MTEDGPTLADGNVITGAGGADLNATDGDADTQGADGASVTAVSFGATPGTVGSPLAGAYGSLTLGADGSYSYTLNNAHPLVQGLDGNDTLTEVFNYTLTDGDGDEVERGDSDAAADNRRDQHQLALAAEKQIGAMQCAMQRGVTQRHQITAAALNSVDRMLVEKMISEITSTSMMIRRTKSLISPPNTSVAPATTTPISEIA